ncbi:methylosome protein 50-like [Argiope bruennichi]|uniref:Methylosome protein 50 like protein n=1 Tax=Argiope bruennichi TaxID=94029 RepID=A0A8T0EZH3_ARGBR|nr:methylosome protein 50-like [Argiope bruennichi]KAF8783084.1 Methylosome protein 50 like protein [Argiope bruennichi]
MSGNIPAVVETHLDAIHCTSDGRIILGSSNLAGRYWNGSLFCFPTVEDAPHIEKCLTGIEVSAGICDMEYLNKDYVALGLDSGGLEVYKFDSEPANFSWVFGVCEHDDFISSLSLNADKSSLVTAGADKCVKIWDVESWGTTATYRPVHGGIIWQVACSSEDSNLFLTCGQDGNILLFDLRLPKPASIMDNNSLKDEPTALTWQIGSPSSYVVGDASGLVALKDIRNTGTVCSWNPHKRRICRLLFSKSKPWLASIADDTDVCVTEIGESPTEVYKNDDHQDFVRGLTWNEKNELISCGWDKKVLKHVCEKEESS